MRKLLTLCFLLFSVVKLWAQTPEEVEAYVNRYKKLAIDAQINFGIPAAVTLAQGIHESGCGKSMLATEANNHFGIKCKSTWKGETILHDDDAKQECFRRYAKAEDSYYDHSRFLKDQDRYHFLFDIKLTDYKGWASGLKRAGYATNPAYVTRLIDLIERFNLQQYTYEGMKQTYGTSSGEIVPDQDKKTSNASSKTQTAETSPSDPTSSPTAPLPSSTPSVYFKGLKGFWAKKGETLQDKAFEFNIRYPRLLLLNDLADAPLEHDQFIFIEKKRKVGPEEYHLVKEGEDMHIISQREAMLLDNLYLYNNLRPGQEPLVGERLYLQYKSYTTPKIKQVTSNVIETTVERPVVVTKTETEQKPVVKQVEVVEPKKPEPKVIIPEENLPTTPEPTHVNIPQTITENKTTTNPTPKPTPVVETRIQPTLVEETPKTQPKQIVTETRVQPMIVETKELPKTVVTITKVAPILNVDTPKVESKPLVQQVIIQPVTPAAVNVEEVAKSTPQQVAVIEIKEEPKLSTSNGSSPILDTNKAKKVELLFAPDQKSEVTQLSETERKEKERIEKELLDKKEKTEAYVKSVTDRIDEERRKQEAQQDEEMKKRRAMEEEERNRIDQEQKERDRLEVEAKAKADAILKEKERMEKEKEAARIREEEERSKRRYDEPGTSDTIRDLKRKLDDIVYRSLPERKSVFVKPVKDTPVKPTPVVVKPVVKDPNKTTSAAQNKNKKDEKSQANLQSKGKKEADKKGSSGKNENGKDVVKKGKKDSDKKENQKKDQSKHVKSESKEGKKKPEDAKSKTKNGSQAKGKKPDPKKKK